ncbi:unnamed protein product [Penicillium viridicatum]
MDPTSIPGIPSSLPILKIGDPVPEAGPWSKYIERLPWSATKEGELVKSVFLKFLMGQEKKREPVVRSTMGLQPERWNEDLGSNIQNVEALFIQMVGREASVRCDHCLAGRGIFALCVVVDEPGFPKCCGNFSVPNAGVYGGVATTGMQTSAPSAARLRAEITAERQTTAESASSALQAVQSRVDQSLPVRYNDVVRVRDSIQATTRTASRVKSTSEAVAFHQDCIKEDVEGLRARFGF